MHQSTQLISNATLLKVLQPEEIQKHINSGKFRVVSYKRNSVIHFEGEPCSKLEIILSGNVVVERIDQSGGLLTIAEFCSDDILGGNLLFSRNPCYPMTITAQQPSVILEIEKELLFELFCNSPSFLRMYLEYVSDHAFILGDKIKHYINKTIRESILSFIDHEIKMQNSNYIRLHMTKKALAEKIGVERTSLSRELLKMKKDGLIVYDAESITLLKESK